MPNAIASQETSRVELKTLKGGFVVLRKLSYGEVLRLRQLSQKLEAGSSDNGTKGKASDNASVIVTFEKSLQYSFSRCVVDHNLEDEKGKKLNFSDPQDLLRLDIQIGQEIEEYIEALNAPVDLDAEGPNGERPFPSESE